MEYPVGLPRDPGRRRGRGPQTSLQPRPRQAQGARQ